ncbi:AMP-dependent synthetase/ligase [Gephyromycinifex aptenodytis]|uniref:AMP-dependent synthetase/ligase n=1 Tax=Gephyromycinifex aptenodytis TaxID=2716227 RepID=UPI0014458911|nr:long-chain fatty acid--CoA ligase [Gephyromycinifex aptenodytis]
MTQETLARSLVTAMETHAERTALRVRRQGRWQCLSYTEMDRRTKNLAAALLASGLERGDRIGIFATNSPEWTLFDIAALRAGLVSVPLYATSSPSQAAHILSDSGCRLVACGSTHILAQSLRAIQTCPQVSTLVLIEGDLSQAQAQASDQPDSADLRSDITLHTLSEFEQIADPQAWDAPLQEVVNSGELDDLTTIVYTSGTTGSPKGVMLTNRTLLQQIKSMDLLFDLRPGQRNMCFLPLSHAYERAWTYVMLHSGLENCYVLDPKAVAAAMLDIQPDTFVSVPRLYEKVYDTAHTQAGSGLKRRIFDEAVRTGALVQRRIADARPIGPALKARHAIADSVVLHRVRDAVGGPKNVMAAGGAPLRREVEEFFFAAGLTIYQGYGLTETSPLVSCNAPGQVKFGTVGKPVPGTEVRLDDETGEILVRGDNVMAGYYGDPEASAEVIDEDGWFHTGDVGQFDEDGYLLITDRIKDLIVTAQGKNIAPGPIESALTASPLVEAAVVVGDERKYLTALIQPAFEALEEHARSLSWVFTSRAELVKLPQVQKLYSDIKDKVGRDAAPYERVQKLHLLDTELTMDDEDLTPTLKVRRRRVEQKFLHFIDAMYKQ